MSKTRKPPQRQIDKKTPNPPPCDLCCFKMDCKYECASFITWTETGV